MLSPIAIDWGRCKGYGWQGQQPLTTNFLLADAVQSQILRRKWTYCFVFFLTKILRPEKVPRDISITYS